MVSRGASHRSNIADSRQPEAGGSAIVVMLTESKSLACSKSESAPSLSLLQLVFFMRRYAT
jgi:hypothetical protein